MDFLRYFIDFYINLCRGYSYVVTEIAMYFGIVCLFFPFKKKEMQNLWGLLDFLIMWIVGTILSSFIYWIDGFKEPYSIEIVLPLIMVSYAIIRAKCSYNLRLIYAFIYYAVLASSLIISSYFGALLFSDGISISKFPLTLVVQIILIVSTILVIRIPRLEKFDDTNVLYSYVVLLIPVTHIVIIYIIKFIDVGPSLPKTIFNIAFIILEYLIYTFYYFIMNEHQKNYEYQALEIKKEQDAALTMMAKDNWAMLSKVRHDMKNHLAYMETLIKEKKYDELDAYFSQYSTEIYDAVKFSNCGNSSIDYILNLEIQNARRSNVTLTYLVSVAPTLPIKGTDLTSLLMNALDNAIEAASLSEEKKVNFSMKQEGLSILLTVTNAVKKDDKNINFKKSSKRSVGHGYGIKIMNGIAEKYGGAIEVKRENDCVILSCMLSLYEKEKENAK